MYRLRTYASATLGAFILLCLPALSWAQTPAPTPPPPQQEPIMPDHDHMNMDMSMGGGWAFMQDGVVFGLFNHQGGARGDDEVKAPNWWMGMLTRPFGRQQITLTSMLSLDRVTVGRRGSAELFQAGETLGGQPNIDRQHPHDFFMQLAGAWRLQLGEGTGLTIAGGPAGEPALGPVAFMHRASAAENPLAPIGHHTLDSTHISYGVVTASLDHGAWAVEGSAFNGREPDENRWNLDLGALDSVSGRVWLRPWSDWEFQVSTGHLTDPERLEPGNVVRTTASGSWLRKHDSDFVAVTLGAGVNRKDDENHGNVFAEATWRKSRNAIYGRAEVHQPEISLLLTGQVPTTSAAKAMGGTLVALTAGGVRDVATVRGFNLGLGGDVTAYRVPPVLRTGAYGRPVSFQIYLRLRLPAVGGRMWNMRMAGPV